MCDYGRLNYKWINREDRLTEIHTPTSESAGQPTHWWAVTRELAELFKKTVPGTVGIVASARQTNEELYLLSVLAKRLAALTDSVPRPGQADKLLLSADRNPNSAGARLLGISAEPAGSRLPAMAEAIRQGKIKTLIVFGEDVTRYGIGPELLRQLETLVVSDILPNATTAAAHYILPGCAHAEKRGSFTNGKGRVQRFLKAIEPQGDARSEWEFLHDIIYGISGQNGIATIEGLFNQIAREVPAFGGLSWGSLGDQGKVVEE
jgi:NADH-quinone oxidoreductase subunit G